MEHPIQLEAVRYVGDKRNQRVYDLELLEQDEVAERVADIVEAEQYATFGPDTLDEARNRGYRAHQSIRAAETTDETE